MMEICHPQHAMWAKCLHPSGAFSEFSKEEVEQSIASRFEKIVGKYPERLAVKTKSHVMTYAMLNATANRVAHAILAEQGSEAAPVGLLFENGAPLIAAMLGVLKAGQFFVLLDPSFPKARIAATLEDSQAGLVMTSRQNAALATELQASNGCRLLECEAIDGRISSEDLKRSISPKASACIVYTSGSTGQPKGVVWDHRYLLHCVMLRTDENRACEHDRITLLSSSTGNAVTNIFLALLNGATLLPFDVQKEGVARLVGWLLQERISICPISSPLFRNLCETLTGAERFPDLRVIRLRSETVYKTDVDLYKKYFSPTCVFVTGLSSGEAGQLTTYLVDHSTEIAGSEVPVGYAVKEKEISLLDDAGNEVGFNEVGEIAVRSRYLSSSYWRRPDLDNAKFKPDPKGDEKRLYLTGDLGLRLPDGCLIYKGRKDFRVKIRGYGVEIAEVEKVLRDHAALDEAVVVARENELGEARLVAYFTSSSQSSPSVSELRGFLKLKLPEYMIPSAFVMVDAIPLTSNGKVDRRALPDPKDSRPELDMPFLAPRTAKEEQLVKIWAEVLGLDRIGIHDDFFDLGGHSLLATRVLSRVRDDLQVELSLSHFFETPTVAALAGYIERAHPPQHGAKALALQPASRGGTLLLSFAQQRLWFLDQLAPGSTAHNLFVAVQLTGHLNVMALERSFNEIIGRHEVLRTVLSAVDGEPLQVILPSMTIQMPVIDLREILVDTEREAEAHHLATLEAQRPFDLARGPLLRATLLRLAEDEYRLLLTIHHVVFDGWSKGILAQELSALYEALSSGRPASLPSLPMQYADFAQWQRQWLQGEVLAAQLAYWKQKLADAPTLQLPTDRPRPAVQSSRGARQWFVLPNTLSRALRALSRQERVTLFMTLLAAFQTLLSRYTGQTDIVIGSPITGRNRRELEDLIGCFLNMLVLRTDLSGNPTFRELLARVREVCLEAYAHQDVPFEKLVEELHLERNLSRNPLFQVTFLLQHSPRFAPVWAGLTATDLDVDAEIARFDLNVVMVEEEGGLRGYVDYNTDLLDAATIIRLLSHFQTLLEGIVAHPDARIGNVPLLTEAERYQLLVERNDTRTDSPKDRCIHALFEAQVERSPDAVAVVFEDNQLTYRELNRRANQLAHYLRRLGVGPEILVGLCVERSLEMVVGLLGVLKAGGAYVPLDPAYPKERLAFMLQDAQVPVVLTQQRLAEGFGADGTTVVCLDGDWEAIAHASQDAPIGGATAANLAYVIYTSGSTGQPKGVQIMHGSVLNCLLAMRQRPGLTAQDVLCAVTTVSFDIAALELFLPLTVGALLVVVSHEVAADGAQLSKRLADSGATAMQATPAGWVLLLEAGWRGSRRLKILCGGEALPRELAGQLRARGASLWNLYGPTETTIWSAAGEVVPSEDGAAPIGPPLANAQLYLLDGHCQAVPMGVPGELYIGGVGLARGYLNRPELTAERFVPNAFSREAGARLYKTGDLARYLPDGNIGFLGRLDHQVKLRGFRIELGEIEAVLRQNPVVRDAVVVAREDDREDTHLVAYVVAKSEPIPTASELRRFLTSKLPEYMIPSAVVFLDTLPLMPNGKVNRRALPAPVQARTDLGTPFVGPRGPVEERLAEIWAEVLKLERVGVGDNFFDLGGHSLSATRVISRVRKAFQIEVPLRALFENPTVAGLAVPIEQALASEAIPEGLADTLGELEALSDEEVQRLLAREGSKRI
jgi:amino acid adenylation domain-containing protein